MSELLLKELEDDLAQFKRHLDLLSATKEALGVNLEPPIGDERVNALQAIVERVRESHSAFPVLYGGIHVVVSGRFENYAKLVVEDIALRVAQKAEDYTNLPRDMRDHMLKLTGIVVSNPRKYRMEKFVSDMVDTLAKNLATPGSIEKINHYCLTITEENLRSTVLDEMFTRLGAKDLWSRIGQNAKLQAYLGAYSADEARAEAQKRLNKIMDDRNTYAHPSKQTAWPSATDVEAMIEFLSKLAAAISDLVPVYEGALAKT